MPSDLKSYPTESQQEVEPLMEVGDVLGWSTPEKIQELPEETQAAEALYNKRDPYQVWQSDPTADNLFAVVKHLSPTIQHTLASLNGTDPNIRSKARVVAAKAIQSYDPFAGTSLPTWVSQQLRQLTRDIRKSKNILSVPEGIQLDAYNIFIAQNELEEELGREPTVDELADRTHLSIKRLQQVRSKAKPVTADASYEAEDGTALTGNATDYSKEATQYVYNDCDWKDKKIIEYTTGFGGSEILSNSDIMNKLGLTDVQLSRRKMRLSQKIVQNMQYLNEV